MKQDMTHNMYKDIVRMTAMTARIVLTGLILLMTGGNAAAQGVHVEGNVFGGGNLADVGGNVTVNISAGTVDKDVYGGGAKANTNTDNWNFDGGTEYVQVNVIVDETVVTGMYTESGGTYTKIIAEGTKAVGNTTYYKKVGVWKESSGTTGGYIAATSTTTSSTYYKTTVNLLGGTITGNAYGGGLGEGQGATGTPAYVYGDVKVNLNGLEAATDIDETTLTTLKTGNNARLNENNKVKTSVKGCAVTRVFGCNNLNGTPKGHVKVNVYATQNSSTTSTSILPKGNSHTDKETGTTTTYDVTAVYGGGNLSPYDPVDAYSTNNDVKLAAKTEVLIDGCGLTSIKQVYGGGNAASAPATYVRVDGTFEIEELFGGGNGNADYQFNGKWYKNPGANVGYTNYTHLDGNGDGSTASPYTCVDNDNAKTKAGRQTEANGYMYGSGIAHIEAFGGKIFASYGGSNKKGNVRVEARSKYEEAGDCALNVVETYGGGKDSEIDGVINLNVGCVKNMDQIFGGSKNAPVYSDIVLNIHNGHYHQVFGGNNTSGAIHGSITVNIEEKGCVPIDIDELYIGGYLAPYSIYGYKNDGTPLKEGDTGALETPYKQPRLNVISASRIGDIFGGGYQATVVGDPHVNVNMEAGKVEVKKTEITAADAATDEYSAYAFRESEKYYIYTYKYYTSATAYTEYKVKNDVISNISGKYYAPLTLGTIENVYGGGNEANIVGDTYVEIGTGKWLKDGTDDVWETKDAAGNTYTFEKKGSDTAPKWYKGDDAQESAPTPRRKAAKISGDVFGGGQGVNTGDATDVDIAKVEGNTNIQFDNGTIAKSVYGGGKLAQVSGTTTINITGGTATTVIGTTGEGGATYGNVYGGGFGHTADKLFGRIMGNTNVNISGGAILHNVYGGGAYGSVGTFSYDTAEMPSGLSTASTGTTNVTITGGTIGTNGDENGMVFGSSRGDVATPTGTPAVDPNDKLAWVYDANVIIGTSGATTGPQINGSVYGSGENGHTYHDADVKIYSGTIGIASGEDIGSYSGAAYPYRGNVYGGGCGTDKYDSDNDNVKDAYNSLAGVVQGTTSVTITGGTVVHNVYGAGALGSVGKKGTTGAIESGGTTTIAISGGTIGVSGNVDDGNVFGAARGDLNAPQGYAVVKTTNVTISQAEGKTTTIWGSVYGGGALGDVGTYTTSDGTNTFDSGSGACVVTISGGTIHHKVFGAGKGDYSTYECKKAMVNSASVTITNGTVGENVYGGGQIARVENNTVVAIGLSQEADGTTKYYQKNTDESYTEVTKAAGDNVAGLYTRSGEEDPYTYTLIEASEPVITGSVFGAGAGVETHGYSALVRGNSSVTIEGEAKVRQNVYGGGQIATVGRYKVATSDDLDDNAFVVAHPGIEVGMPYEKKSGGKCTVIVRGDAVVGPGSGDASETAGMVFGAGKGVGSDIYNSYAYTEGNTSTMPWRMTTDPGSGKRPTYYDDLGGGFIKEYYPTLTTYFKYLETLALATETDVTITGRAAVKGSVFGGSESGFVQDNTKVKIQNGTIGASGNTAYGNVFGGGKGLETFAEAGRVRGNTSVAISNGTVYGNVYGGGKLGDVGTIDKTEKDDKGNLTYNYKWKQTGGTGNNTAESNKIIGKNNNTGNCLVTITGGTIGSGSADENHGNVFGAGKGTGITWWCEKAIAYSTAVYVEDGTVYGNVYGGGQVGRVEDDARVTIGKTDESGNGSKPDIKGSVFGAGAGLHTHGYSALVRGNAKVTVQGIAKVGGSVYGGGETASVGRFTVVGGLPKHPDSGGYCTVTIQDGATIGASGTGHDVFGACKGVDPSTISSSDRKSMQLYANRGSGAEGTDWDYYESSYPEGYEGPIFVWKYYKTDADYLAFLRTLALTSHPHVTIAEDATVYGSVYGGGQRGITLGHVDVDITGGTVEQDVYGGGALADTNTGNWDADSYTEVTGLTAGESSVSGLYERSGDGSDSSPYIYTLTEDETAGSKTYYSKGKWADATLMTGKYKTTVKLTGGTIKGDAYGGGLGQKAGFNGATSDIAAVVWGDISVTLDGTAFEINKYTDAGYTNVVKSGRVFGCNNLNGSPQGDVTVTVNKTVEGNSPRTSSPPKVDGYGKKLLDDPAYQSTYEVAAVYGGGNLAPYKTTGKKTHVIINGCGETSIETVYGGGNAAAVPETKVDIYGTYEIGCLFGGGNGKDRYWNGSQWVPNPGANVGKTVDGEVIGNGNTTTWIYGGTIHEAYGASNEKGTITGSVFIDVGTSSSSCTLDVGKMVGAGKNADVNGDIITILGCKPDELIPIYYGGADNANVNGNVELTITSGKFGQVFGGNNLGGAIRGHIIVNIEEITPCSTPIVIDKLYLGGNQASYSRYGYYVKTTTSEGPNASGVGASTETAVLTTGDNPKLIFMPRTSTKDLHLPVDTYWYDEAETDPTKKWKWTTTAINAFTPYDEPQLNVISCTSINEVFGGGYGVGGDMYANPTVNINMIKGTMYSGVTATTENPNQLGVIGTVYGGGDAADVLGSTTVNIGTEPTVDIFELEMEDGAPKQGEGGAYIWKTTKKTETVLGAYISGNVFGGGKGQADSFACSKAMIGKDGAGESDDYTDGNTNVNIGNGTVMGNVYGGGEIGRVERNTTVTIGLPDAASGESKPDIKGSVFGGGKGKETHGYAALVRGNPTVIIQADAKVEHNVYGGGEIASVARYKVAQDADEAAAHGVGVDMPYALANTTSGNCHVTVKDRAVIGPDTPMKMYHEGVDPAIDTPDDAGHVFGAGKGILPENYTYADKDNKPKRMVLRDETIHTNDKMGTDWEYVDPSDNNNNNVWEYFADMDAYVVFIQTLALSSYANVTIGDESTSKPFVKGSVYGGSENGLVQFNTNVYIKSGQIGWGKYAQDNNQGAYGDDVWLDTYVPSDAIDLECPHWVYGKVEGTKTIYAPYDPNANASGDLDKYPPLPGQTVGKSTEGGRRIATDGHTYYGNVFGGGSGSVPYYDTSEGISKYLNTAGTVKGNTYVEITGGHILTNVYGGCEATNVLGKAMVKMTGGTLGVPRTEDQIKNHPVTCYLFGAGKGDQRIFFNKDTNVNDAEVEVDGGRVYGSVFGGGEDGHVMRHSLVTIKQSSDKTTKIGTTGNTYVDGNIFGGGRGFGGDALTAGNVGGCVEVNIEGGTMLGSIYGGGRLASVGYGLYLTTGAEAAKYGKMRADNEYDDPDNPISKTQDAQAFFAVNPFTGKAFTSTGRGKITINIKGGTIGNDVVGAQYGGNVFGGSMGRLTKLDGTPFDAADHWALLATAKSTTVNINGGTIKRSVYGGGEMGTVTEDATVTVSGGIIGIEGNGGVEFGNVYGGGKGYFDESNLNNATYVLAGIVKGNTNVNINNGTIYHNIYGGGAYGSVGDITLGSATYVPGLSSVTMMPVSWTRKNGDTGKNTGTTTVTIKGGNIGIDGHENGMIFGSSRGDVSAPGEIHDHMAWVYDTHVVIGGDDSDPLIKGSVYGGGENGHVFVDAEVKVHSGTVGMTDDPTYPNRGNVYGAGCGTDTYTGTDSKTYFNPLAGIVLGNTTVEMDGGRVIRTIYGGGAMGSVGTYTTNDSGKPTACKENTGLSTVNISGGKIGPETMVMPNNYGNVFGAGRGEMHDLAEFPNLEKVAYFNKTKVTISGSALVKGSVYGGSESGHVLGNTKVIVSGGQIGCGNGKDAAYTDEEWSAADPATLLPVPSWTYTENGYAYDKFAGTEAGKEDKYPDGTSTEGGRRVATDGHTFYGNVFGGGSGYEPYAAGKWLETAGRVEGQTEVEITGGHILSNVYGGNECTDVLGTCTVTMSDGTVGVPYPATGFNPALGHLFGAGKGDKRIFFNTWTNVKQATVSVSGGRVFGSVYGGGEDGHVGFEGDTGEYDGDAKTTISGDAHIGTNGNSGYDGNVFGGGQGSLTALTAGVVQGNVTLNIEDGQIDGSVYGGGRLASVGTHLVPVNSPVYGELQNDDNHGNIKINLTGGTINQDVFGGSMGSTMSVSYPNEKSNADMGISRDVTVELNKGVAENAKGCIVDRIFGANNVNGTPKGHVKVHVHATQNKDQNDISTKSETKGIYDMTYVFGGGNASDYVPEDETQSTEVIIDGCGLTSIYEVYGGGYGAATPGTNVRINGTEIIDNVFGGGYGAGVGNPGANVGYRTDHSPYGLYLNDNKTKIAIVNLMAGKVNSVYGGSNTKGDIRNGAATETVDLVAAEGACPKLEVGELYGGGKNAEMEGGAEIILRCMPDSWIGEVYAGAREANVGNDVSLTITSGKFEHVYGGNKSSGKIDGYVEVNIEECPTCNTPVIIGELYGGGNEAAYNLDTEKYGKDYPSPRVNVRAFTSIGTIYGGGKGEGAKVTGNPTVSINVGMVDGGGYDYDPSEDKNKPDGVTLYSHEKGKIGVIGNVFGGGNAAEVNGSTNVLIGTESYVQINRIVAGETDLSNGDYYTRSRSGAGTEEDPYVYTYTKATGIAKENTVYYTPVIGVDIKGNVYGGGNNAGVTGNTNVTIGKEKVTTP